MALSKWNCMYCGRSDLHLAWCPHQATRLIHVEYAAIPDAQSIFHAEEAMIYTLGRPGTIHSRKGGSVWETQADVKEYLASIPNPGDYVLFRVTARWGLDTQPVEDCSWHELLIDCACFPTDEAK